MFSSTGLLSIHQPCDHVSAQLLSEVPVSDIFLKHSRDL